MEILLSPRPSGVRRPLVSLRHWRWKMVAPAYRHFPLALLVTMEMRNVRVRFGEDVDASRLSNVDGVTILHQSDGYATFRVAGEMDGLIKGLAAYPVSDIAVDRTSLEEVFLRYYQAGKKENG